MNADIEQPLIKKLLNYLTVGSISNPLSSTYINIYNEILHDPSSVHYLRIVMDYASRVRYSEVWGRWHERNDLAWNGGPYRRMVNPLEGIIPP
jgi:hypothetical protein